MKVVSATSWDKAETRAYRYSMFGGFFEAGMRWGDYLKFNGGYDSERLEALRSWILERKIKECGPWHQIDDQGVPVFDDGTAATFSFRGWGDLLAAVWSTEEDTDYNYMDFYY